VLKALNQREPCGTSHGLAQRNPVWKGNTHQWPVYAIAAAAPALARALV
jgi:hypothetical protein